MLLRLVAVACLVSVAVAARNHALPRPQREGIGFTTNNIVSLPGYGTPKEVSYSGYLSVDPTGKGSLENGLFYWLFYSRNTPWRDPLGMIYPFVFSNRCK